MCIDIIFAIDIFFLFFTEFQDNVTGEFFTRPKKIAKHYIRNGFIADFIATIPLVLSRIVDSVFEKGTSDYDNAILVVLIFRHTKLFRLRKMHHLITTLNSSQ